MTDSRHHSPLPLRILAAILIAYGLVPVANILTDGKAVPWWPAAVTEWAVSGFGIVAVAVLLAILLRERLDLLIDRARQLLLAPSPRAFALGAGGAVLLLSAFLARYCFAGQGFTGDEMAQRWHAQMLLAGRLFLPAEAHREFFSTPTVIDADGRWYSQFPIGGPAFLAIGLALRAAWLVNPVLAALTTANVYRFAARAFDETTARVSALLFALSPFVLIMSASQMNHVATLAMASFALAALPVWAEEIGKRRTRAAIVIGVSLGLATAVRPLDGAIAAAVIGVFQLALLRHDYTRWRSIALQCAAGAVPVAILLWANWRTTGSPFVFGYEALNGPEHSLGFHGDPSGLMHTPERGLIITSGYLMKLNRYLFEWPIPALALIAATLLAVRHATKWDFLLAGLTAAVAGVYATYWFDGFFAGPRFLYLAVPALVVFTARMPAAVTWGAGRWALGVGRGATILLIPLCIAYAWIVPRGVSNVQTRIAYYRELRSKLKTDIGDQIARARRDGQLDHALVFVRESWHARLVARLRALDMPPLMAEQVLDHGDACALQTALDITDRMQNVSVAQRRGRVLAVVRRAGWARPVPGLPAENRVSIVPGSRPTTACLREVEMDIEGTMPYALFLSRQEIDANGHVGGRIVFARDLGPRNALLKDRFGDRTWYRYRALGAGRFALSAVR